MPKVTKKRVTEKKFGGVKVRKTVTLSIWKKSRRKKS
jgi:hypothetical protein